MADKDWRVTVKYTGQVDARVYDSTFCVRESVSLPGADNLSGATVAADLVSWFKTEAKAMAPAALELTEVSVNRGGVWGPGEGDPQEAGLAGVAELGTLAAGTGTLPHGLCARVTIKTGLASKRGTGRFHAPWPGYSSFLASFDAWASGGTYMTAVTNFANKLLAGHDVTHDAVDHHYSLRVHSRRDATTRDALSVVPRTQVSYIRSRLSAP